MKGRVNWVVVRAVAQGLCCIFKWQCASIETFCWETTLGWAVDTFDQDVSWELAPMLTCLGAPLSGCIALSVRWRRGRVVRRHVCSFSDTKCNVSYWLVLTFDWQVIMAPLTCTSTPTRRVPCQTPVSSPSRRIVSLAPSTCPRLSAERVSPSLSAGPRYHDITQHVRPVGFIIVTFL